MYELPVEFKVTLASSGEAPIHHELLEEIDNKHPEITERCQFWSGDRGYDDGKLTGKLWDDYEIKPVIDIRNMWERECSL